MMADSNSDQAGVLNFICRKGDTFLRILTFKTGEGVPIDKSSSTYRLQIKSRNAAIKTLTSPAGITVSENVITIRISATDMNAMFPGNFMYDLQQTYPDGTVKTILKGQFIVNPDITQ